MSTKQVIVLVLSSFRFKFLCYFAWFGVSNLMRERHPYLMTVMGCEIFVYKSFTFPGYWTEGFYKETNFWGYLAVFQ